VSLRLASNHNIIPWEGKENLELLSRNRQFLPLLLKLLQAQ
jgi:hypothetical protein